MKKFILLGTIIAFGLSSILHFAFDFLGSPMFLSGFFPISESIWEHLKLPFYSLLLILWLPIFPEVKGLSFCTKVKMSAVSSAIAMVIVFFGYYGLKSGLSVEGFFIDLLLLAVGLIVGLLHAANIAKKKTDKMQCVISVLFLACMILLFYYFSFHIPNLPGFSG